MHPAIQSQQLMRRTDPDLVFQGPDSHEVSITAQSPAHTMFSQKDNKMSSHHIHSMQMGFLM